MSERYALTSQARRAATGVPINIAEGSARRGAREFRHFLNIALGSLSELTCILRLARDLGFVDLEKYTELDDSADRAGRALWRLYQQVSQSI